MTRGGCSNNAAAGERYREFLDVTNDGDEASIEWIRKMLADNHSLRDIKNPMGNNLLHHACYAGLVDTAKFLLEVLR